jgi:hypothetical protein
LIVWLFCAAAALGSPGSIARAQFQHDDPSAGEGEEGEEEAPPDEDEAGEPEEEPEEEPAAETPEESAEEESAEAEEPSGEEGEEDGQETPQPSTTRLTPADPVESEEDTFFLVPPVLIEERAGVSTTAVFPFFYLRSEADDDELVVPPYYMRRSLELNVDVVFPFFWSFREVDSSTLAIPPFYYTDFEDGFALGLAPLFFLGRSAEASHTILPGLVAYADEDEAYTFAGPFYRIRDEEIERWGIFPFLWVYNDDVDTSVLAPPFLFHFDDDVDDTSTTVVPPLYHLETPEHAMTGVPPLFHYYSDDEGSSLTIPPLAFHYGVDGDDSTLVTPLFAYMNSPDESTLITWLYQNHRGDTYLDAVAPLFFSWREPRQRASALAIPPLLFYHYEDPTETTNVSFPFFGHWHETGRYTTWATLFAAHYESEEEETASTWIFPTLQISHTPESHTFNFHPLFYSTEAETYRHLVVAPIYWDFEDYEDDTRATVGFPFVWRFRDGSDVHQLAFNTYYHHWRERGGNGWEFHFFPFFAYGEPRPGDYWWSIFYGLAGYRRSGEYAEGRAFWIPFEMDAPEER